MTQHTGIGTRIKLSALVALPTLMWVAPAVASPETSVKTAAAARRPRSGAVAGGRPARGGGARPVDRRDGGCRAARRRGRLDRGSPDPRDPGARRRVAQRDLTRP